MAEETASTTAAETTAATTAAAAATETAARTFSQADLDKIVQDRLARERAKYEGFDDLKKKADEFDKLQEAQKTELERANEARAKAERDAADAAERAQRLLADTAIITAAAGKFADPADAVALLDRAQIDFADDGTPTNVGDLVSALLEAKPHLAASRPVGSADQGARSGGADQITRQQLASMSPEQINKALAEGKLAGVLSGNK